MNLFKSKPIDLPDGPMKIVVAYRGIGHSVGWATGDNLVRAFKRLGHDVYAYGNYYQSDRRIDPKPAPESADLLVYCECNDDDPQYYELSKIRFKRKAYWDFDVDNGRSYVTSKLVKKLKFDTVFYANKLYGDQFRKLAHSSVFLPYAFDDEHFYPIKNRRQKISVGLIGSPYPARRAYIERLKSHGVKVEFIQGKFREDFVQAINGLKIHLNLNIYEQGGEGLLVGRVWETIGCGVFLLSQRKDFIEDFFEDGKHLILFDDEADCAKKIKYYLENSKEREKIARQGWLHGKENHTYIARAMKIIEHLS